MKPLHHDLPGHDLWAVGLLPWQQLALRSLHSCLMWCSACASGCSQCAMTAAARDCLKMHSMKQLRWVVSCVSALLLQANALQCSTACTATLLAAPT